MHWQALMPTRITVRIVWRIVHCGDAHFARCFCEETGTIPLVKLAKMRNASRHRCRFPSLTYDPVLVVTLAEPPRERIRKQASSQSCRLTVVSSKAPGFVT